MYHPKERTEAKDARMHSGLGIGIVLLFLTILCTMALIAYKSAHAETNMNPEMAKISSGTGAVQAEAFFAGGCFWGVEDAFSKLEGVADVVSGYMGGSTANPTYRDVSTGKTGHAETVRVVYDPAKVSYETLARLFFEIHDPAQLNRQGPDVGTQYRSAVFVTDEAQKATVIKLMDLLRANGWDVVTTLEPASVFTPAETEHQDFTARTGRGGCHLRVDRFKKFSH